MTSSSSWGEKVMESLANEGGLILLRMRSSHLFHRLGHQSYAGASAFRTARGTAIPPNTNASSASYSFDLKFDLSTPGFSQWWYYAWFSTNMHQSTNSKRETRDPSEGGLMEWSLISLKHLDQLIGLHHGTIPRTAYSCLASWSGSPYCSEIHLPHQSAWARLGLSSWWLSAGSYCRHSGSRRILQHCLRLFGRRSAVWFASFILRSLQASKYQKALKAFQEQALEWSPIIAWSSSRFLRASLAGLPGSHLGWLL